MAPAAPAPLRAIAAHAAAAAPDRRYFSADALAADIGRFLDAQPVTAYRENALERLRRFGRRNNYYLQIMLPGFVVGAIAGFLTQRLGSTPGRAA